jgi:hypothetical protein
LELLQLFETNGAINFMKRWKDLGV